MTRIYRFVAWFLLLVFIVGGLIYRYSHTPPSSNKVIIITSLYPWFDVVQNVGKELVEVRNITPSGAEPHDYEPTPQDIASIYQARLFIYNGEGIDAWADKLKPSLEDKGIMVVPMANFFFDQIPNTNNDPHFWLDPKNMSTAAQIVTESLLTILPDKEKELLANRDQYQAQLLLLHDDFVQGLKSCQQNTIVTAHNAFNYLAYRYHLNTLFIAGLSPENEPTPQKMAEIVRQVKTHNIHYIFFETLVDPRLATTIADEAGAQTLTLSPLEGLTQAEIVAGKNYVTVMKDNLDHLKIALACQ